MEVDEIHEVDEIMAVEDGCATPKRDECRIREMSAPPPPPRKKPFVAGKKRDRPKNGYFHPPDLEAFFAMAPRPACKLVHA
ncbi:hypothetical protein L484_025279 [Morus notabilis]|uniref:Cyclin-dependent protein kinase inhibitor SMR4 n=1 Tax=Morus notabilis TaxID=981085 RepID=W9RUH3_9ROSA|nr:cyclin-dependent protein kinase inhibitor SMR4 [Morus notabilis]EXC10695.1 hypothetical protein L484_025279 [Morus notabilis]